MLLRSLPIAVALFAAAEALFVPWERALAKYGHHGQSLAECRYGCILPAAWTESTPVVIVTSMQSSLNMPTMPTVEYIAANATNPTPSHPCACRPLEPWKFVYTPWGRENSFFLRFLAQYYNSLPRHILFAHGQQRSWHMSLSIEAFLEASSSQITDGEGDVLMSPDKLSCHNFNAYCGSTATATRFWAAYDALIAPLLPGMRVAAEYDACLALSFRGKPCCGQFLVSRSVAMRRPHSFYKELYAHGSDFATPSSTRSDYLTRLRANLDSRFAGHVMEYMWPFVFAAEPGQLALDGPSETPRDPSRDYLTRLRANLDSWFAGHVMEYMRPFVFAEAIQILFFGKMGSHAGVDQQYGPYPVSLECPFPASYDGTNL
ncbi:hypothetical protein DIPPA_09879 [Diplonema papillatum]|nr:hypothetical protein DIPPA_09879 [Diplonema papillatum]